MKLDTVFSADAIGKRVSELARAIDKEYKGQLVTAVSVLKGSFIFFADLTRALHSPLECEFLALSQRHDHILLDIDHDLKDKNLLIVEELVDTGKTLNYLTKVLSAREPQSLKSCALIRKNHSVKVDFVGFDVDTSHFLVGYGLDHNDSWRSLPDIKRLPS